MRDQTSSCIYIKTPIYLDYNAHCPLLPVVKDFFNTTNFFYGNPSSVHSFGRIARQKIDQARRLVVDKFDCDEQDVVFTSGGTEANNLALKGLFSSDNVYAVATEHDSIRQCVNADHILPVTKDGVIDLDALEDVLKKCQRPVLLSLMMANNETGTTQPIKEVVQIVKKYDGYVHTDAVQIAGRYPLSFRDSGVDMMTISAHKFGGPVGVGVLIVKDNLPLKPHISGGGQERGLRAGTENLMGIMGLGVALNHLLNWDKVLPLRQYLSDRLQTICPESMIFGGNNRLANTLCVSMPFVQSQTQVIGFDLEEIMVSSGSACSSGKVKKSHVLMAMGAPHEHAECALRISLSPWTTQNEIDRFIEVWEKILKQQYKKA